jgi:ABC-type transport system involved in multi-copper enzyme maturation permease subunit
MIKAFQAFLAGIFFTFILDFFFFLGIHLHYINAYEIDVYYNILFADHQSLLLFLLGTVALGYLTIYTNNPKRAALILAGTFALFLLALVPPVGNALGKMLLMKENQTLYDSRYRYSGDVYYDGRSTVWIYDDELGRIVKILKKDLKQ